MKALSAVFFSTAFLSLCMYLGDYYDHLGLSRKAGLIVTAFLLAVFVISYVRDRFFSKAEQ